MKRFLKVYILCFILLLCLALVALLSAPAFASNVLIDNFNDNSIDTTIWNETDGGTNVTEQNQRMEITGGGTWNHNGIASVNTIGCANGVSLLGTWTPASNQFMLFGFSVSDTLVNSGTGIWWNFSEASESGGYTIRVFINGSVYDVGTEVYHTGDAYKLRMTYDGSDWYFYIQSDDDAAFATETLVYQRTVARSTLPFYIHAQIQTAAAGYLDDVYVQYPMVFVNTFDGMVFQRDASAGTGSMPLTGQYDGSPAAIQAKLIYNSTGATAKDWTTIAASPVNNHWSGTLTGVPQGTLAGEPVYYKVQVRHSDTPANEFDDSNRVGMGIDIIHAGQSNSKMAFTSGSSITANAYLSRLVAGVWSKPSTGGDGVMELGNNLISAYHVPVGIVNSGQSGSALTNDGSPSSTGWLWISGTPESPTPGQSFDLLLNSLDTGLIPYKAEAWVFVCGEADAFSTGTTTYYEDFTTFTNSWIRAIFDNGSKASSLPVVFSQTNRYTLGATTDAEWQDVQDDQTRFDVANTELVATQGIGLADFAHWTSAGQITMADRFSHDIEYLNGDKSCSGRITATYTIVDPTHININLTHSCGTDFTPTGATSATTFTVLDDGSPITVNSALYVDATHYQLTLASAYSGTLTVRHDYGKNPTTTNTITDNSSQTYSLESLGSISLYVAPAGSTCPELTGTPLYCNGTGTPLYQGVPNSNPGTPCHSGIGDGTCYH